MMQFRKTPLLTKIYNSTYTEPSPVAATHSSENLQLFLHQQYINFRLETQCTPGTITQCSEMQLAENAIASNTRHQYIYNLLFTNTIIMNKSYQRIYSGQLGMELQNRKMKKMKGDCYGDD